MRWGSRATGCTTPAITGRCAWHVAGAPFELIARQLGHRDVAMVAKVYGALQAGHGGA